MPFPLSRHSVHAYILVHEGCGRIKLFFYAGNFSRDAFVAHVPPILNFKKRGLEGAEESWWWKGTVSWIVCISIFEHFKVTLILSCLLSIFRKLVFV